MKKEISVLEAVEFYKSVENMKESGVSVKGLKNIDLAMNKKNIEPIVRGYEMACRNQPEQFNEYSMKVKRAQNKFTTKPELFAAAVEGLEKEYAKAIAENKAWVKEVNAMPDHKQEVDLLMISKDDFHFEEKNGGAANCIAGLLICVK